MKWKSLFAAALTAAVALPALAQDATGGGIPSGRVISVSVIGGNYSNNTWTALPSIKNTEGQSGLAAYRVDNANWNELTQQNSGNTGGTPETLTALVDNTGAATVATVTARLGGWWHLQATEASKAARMDAVGYMGVGFCDPSKVEDTNELTLANVPYTEYSLILYYGTNHDNNKWAAPKVTFADGTFKTYTYAADATGAATEGTDAWGSTTAATTSGQAGTLGKDVMLIEGLSGNISIDLGTQPDSGEATQAGSLCGFQIVEVLPSISVNFAGDASGTHSVPIPETSDAYGLFPVPGSEWKNGFTGTGAIQVSSAYGSSETFSSTLSYKSKNIWHNTDSYNTLLQTYLDDGTKPDEKITGASISMDNVPFTEYAVIVYCAGGDSAFLPVTVNGKTYTYQDNATVEGSANFGSSSVTTPTLGQNALCVTGLTDAALTVQGQSGGENGARGGIAAIQIICTGEVDASLAPVPAAETSVISLNFGSNYGSVPQTATEYGLVPVPGYTWTNISGKNGTQTVTVASGKPLTTKPTVAYDSDLTYYYDQATDPFLKGYLGDGQRSEGVGASVTVSNLPFWAYDVVVYAGLGDNGAVARPVRVNDTLYTWDSGRGATIATDDATAAYGGIQPTAQYGRNALRVKGLSDYEYRLTVQGLPRIDQSSQRGGIAAIQIVERKVIDNDDIDDLDPSSDTPVYILPTDQIVGNLTLPPDAILDLSSYWLFGATPPITGTLTVNAGTQIRLPKGASWTIAGTIEGADSLAKNAVIVGGSLATGVKVSDGTISADATYVWTGDGNNDLWSNQYNWSSHTVPNAEADVTIPLDANGAVTIELPSDTGAVAKSVTITGPESGSATLALTSAEGGATGSLTVSGRMLATGNVTVTQSADITVNGASELYQPYPDTMPDTWMPELASFQVHQATYKVTAGTLAIPNEAGDLGVSGHGTVEVSGTGAIVANRVRDIYYEQNISNAQGTFRVAESGVLALAKTSSFAQRTPLETLGGALRATAPDVRLSLFAGLALETAPVTVEAVKGATLTLAYTGSNGALLSGSENLTLKGPGSINFNGTVAEDYSGTVTIAEGTSATLGSARPPLAVESEAKVTVTVIDPEETGIGEIAFPTEMETIPDNVTFVVNGLEDGIEVTPAIEPNQLVLKWAVEIPAMTTGGAWGEATKWNTQKVPTTGMARLDGGESGIEVTLDTELSDMESIIVSGVVSLKTTEKQSSIPASIKLEKGATLTIDAPFSGVGLGAQWELPVGTTLRVDDTDFTGWYALNMQGLVEFLPSGSAESPIRMNTDTAQFHGGLTIAGDYVQLSNIVELGGTVTLAGDNISLTGPVEEDATGNVFHCTTNTRIVNAGTGNRIYNLGGCTGTFLVNAGTLSLEVVRAPIAGLVGLVVAKDATLTFEEACVGGQYPLSGEGTVVIAGTLRPQVKAFELDGVTYNTIPAKMVFVATKEEQTNGVIQFLNAGNATVPANFVAEVTPFGDADVWVPVATNGNPIRIYNVPAPNGLTGLDDAVALTLRQAAAKEGITNGDYTVRLRTKGGQTTIASPDAATLNDVLGCFTNLTATAEGSVLTYAYDFGVVGIKRDTAGWVVTAKVQGANAEAGFAEGNVYTLTVNGTEVSVAGATVGEGGTVTLPLPDTAVTGDAVTLGVKVARPAAQP